jgi:transcription elongation GreA/GreB family factor
LLNETQASITLNKELERLIKNRQGVARMLKQQREIGDELVVRELNEQKAEIEENINRVADQLRRLRIPFNRKVRLFFRKYT